MKPLNVSENKLAKTFKALEPVLRPRLFSFLLGALLVSGSTICELLAPYLLGKGVDLVVSEHPEKRLLVQTSAIFAFVVILRALIESFQGLVIQKTGQNVIHDLRVLIFKKIHQMPISYFDANPTGRILTRVVNDIKSVSELFTASISVLILDVTIILGSIVSMLIMDWSLALVVLATFPLVVWTVLRFGEKLSTAYKVVRARLSEVNAFLGENIAGIVAIQRLNAEDSRLLKFRKIVDEHTKAQMNALEVYAAVQPYANIFNGVSMAALMWWGGMWAIQGRISLGVLVAFFAYVRNLFQPIRDLVEKYNTFLSAMVAADRLVAVLDMKSESYENSGNEDIRQKVLTDSFEFKSVSFKYPTRDNWALRDINFKAEAGQSIAIVGATGSGKSTLIRLLMRFYEPTEGSIWVGDVRLDQCEHHQIRTCIGVIQQEIFLFRGTLRENLTLGKTEIDDVFLIDQCKKTHLWDLVKERGGLDLNIAEGGINLSVGEKQLLAFTRMWVFQPRVLVLDEATASVDPISERYLMDAVETGLRGRTSIVIAHRLSTIRMCNKIIVLKDGRIVEEGAYSELLKKRGLFYEFHKIYSHDS